MSAAKDSPAYGGTADAATCETRAREVACSESANWEAAVMARMATAARVAAGKCGSLALYLAEHGLQFVDGEGIAWAER